MDSNHPRRLYESRVLPTELASLNLAGRAGFEPAHGVSNSHVPYQLGYRPITPQKAKGPDFRRSLRELNLNFRKLLWTDQSRRLSAIYAPFHDGIGSNHHCEIQYSTTHYSINTKA